MRALWGNGHRRDYLADALALLAGWTTEGSKITRTFTLDESQHAALTERIKVASDALQLQPEIRRRNGATMIRLGPPEDGTALTAGEVTLAARIENAYRAIVGPA